MSPNSAILFTLSIRKVLIALGAASLLVAAGLAGFGLLVGQQQLEARARVVFLERALRNHIEADAFMDDVRADVMRALLTTLGVNREETTVIRKELDHHIQTVTGAISDNVKLPLGGTLSQSYATIAILIADFTSAGKRAVELALVDAVAGANNYDQFRQNFSLLESTMDEARDELLRDVEAVRAAAAVTASRSRWLILGSFGVGGSILLLITMLAVRLGQKITTDLASSREEAHQLALHDTLTGLPNRASLNMQLEAAMGRVARSDTIVAMFCLDLDRFKQVNDTLGHAIGDELLRVVGSRLRSCVRKEDVVARLGGDEFAVILTSVNDLEEPRTLAQRIVDALGEPYQLEGHQVVVGVSVGVAIAPLHTGDAGILLKMADLALYLAKADGRGRFRVFESGMDTTIHARRTLESGLKQALVSDEFELHYQPLVDLASGEVTTFEALIRWQHPTHGLIPPDQFISIAEETGLIVEIGSWVLRQACSDAVAWPQHIRVAVNVSPIQFKSPGLLTAVSNALAEASLAPNRLELEITETALLGDNQVTMDILLKLRDMGVRIVMDDFGTGYSALSYLRTFPFDKIKIDKSFIDDLENNADSKAIVSAMTGLGTSLNMTTTAEGVETAGQLALLRAQGCNQVQGYVFSRPMPAREIAAMLIEKRFASAA